MAWDFSNWIVGLGLFVCLCLVWIYVWLACVSLIGFGLDWDQFFGFHSFGSCMVRIAGGLDLTGFVIGLPWVCVVWVNVWLGFVCFDRISFGISCLRGFGFDCCWVDVDCVVAGFGCDYFRFTIGFLFF
jgi:hypothetical protein